MYNYFSDFIWKADIVCLFLSGLLIFSIFCYVGIKEYFENIRIKRLHLVKKNVYRLVFNKAKVAFGQETFLTKNISTQMFIDVAANRLRREFFFNQAEQKIFEKEYVSQVNIERLKVTARRSIRKWHRIEAILALGYAGIDSSLEILKSNLFNKDDDIVYFSMLALCQLKNIDSARVLLQFLKESLVYRYKIASLLGQFPSEISSEAIKLVYDKDPFVRSLALRIISDIKGVSCVNEVEKLIKDKSSQVRAAACQCLGVIGTKDNITSVKECIKDDEWLVRSQAVEALDNLLGSDCVALIISLVKDNSWVVIDSVKRVLSRHIEAAMPYLKEFLTQDDNLAKKISIEVIELSGCLDKR